MKAASIEAWAQIRKASQRRPRLTVTAVWSKEDHNVVNAVVNKIRRRQASERRSRERIAAL